MKESSKNLIYKICYATRNFLNTFLKFDEIAILAYHSISDERIDTAVTASEFIRQIEYIRDKGFSFVSLDSVIRWVEGTNTSLYKAIAMTFDDGYEDFETVALPILEKYQIPSTLFLMGDGTASRKKLLNEIPLLSTEAIERLQNNPLIEIGFHGMTHANLENLHTEELAHEIESILPSSPTRFFAYPGGHYSTEAIEQVERAGYVAAVSIKRSLVNKQANRYLLPRSVVTHTMKPWQVGVHVTKAIDWYRALTGLVK